MKSSTVREERAGSPHDRKAWALAQRVAASRHFARAAQLQRFLLFICEKSIFDGITSISEHEIGHQVLGRRADYDPNEDNIVRVQARHLRQKLEEYFRTDGKAEPVMITIPKGSYVPQFVPRPAPDPHPGRPLSTPSPGEVSPSGLSRLLVIFAAVAALLAAGWFLTHLPGSTPDRPMPASPAHPFWGRVFQPGIPATIVLADINLVTLQMVTGIDVSLEDYLRPDYPRRYLANIESPELRKAFEYFAFRQFTTYADANMAVRLSRLADRHGVTPSVKLARHMHIRDLKGGNLIFLGSHSGIPWVSLFEDRLNFRLERDTKRMVYRLTNRRPMPGEPTEMQTSPGGDETYAAIVMAPGLDDRGVVVILNGIDMVAAEAAGDLASSEGFVSEVRRRLGQPDGPGPLPFFEVLIRVSSISGAASKAEIIAHRSIASPVVATRTDSS